MTSIDNTNNLRRERALAGALRAKSRGLKLGNPNSGIAWEKALESITDNANNHARTMAEPIRKLQQAGHLTLTALADELNARKIPTARGGKWYPATVKNILERLERLEAG